MKIFLKILTCLLVVILVTAIIIASMGLYFYNHPERTKAILLKSLTKTIGRNIETKVFFLKLEPLRIEIKNLRIFRKGDRKKPEISVNRLSLAAESSKRNRWDIWHYKYLRIQGVKLNLSEDSLKTALKPSSAPTGLFSKLVRPWLIRNIKKKFCIREITISDVSGSWKGKNTLVSWNDLTVNIGQTAVSKIGPVSIYLGTLQLLSHNKGNFSCKVENIHATGRISPFNGNIDLETRLSVGNIGLTSRKFRVTRLSLDTSISYVHPIISFHGLKIRIPSTAPMIIHTSRDVEAWGSLTSELSLDTRKKALKQSEFTLRLLDDLEIRGTAVSSEKIPSKITVQANSSSIPVEKLFSRYKSIISPDLRKLEFLVPWHPGFKITAIVSLTGKTPAIDAKLNIKSDKLAVKYKRLRAKLKPQLDLRATFKDNKISVETRLKCESGSLSASKGSTIAWSSNIFLTFKDSLLNIHDIKLKARSTGKPVVPKFELSGKSTLDINSNSIKEAVFLIHGPQIGKIKIDATGSWAKNSPLTCTISWEKHDLGKLLDFYKLVKAPWEIHTQNKIKITYFSQSLVSPRINVSIRSDIESLTDSDYQYGGDKLTVRSELSFLLGEKNISLKGNVLIPNGELLLNLYYVNFSNNSFSWHFSARYNKLEKFLFIKFSHIRLKKIIAADFPGKIRFKGGKHLSFNFDLKISETPVTQSFDFFVREPYKDEFGFLSKISTGGKMRMSLSATGSADDPTIRGKIFLEDVTAEVSGKSKRKYQISGEIPIWFRPFASKIVHKISKKPLEGKISVSASGLPLITTFKFNNKLYALPNFLRLNDSISIKNDLLDVNIEPVEIRYRPSDKIEIDTGAQINDVNIGKLISSFLSTGKHVDGHLRGSLPVIKVINGNLKTTGSLTAKIFQGTLRIRHITVENVFTENRILGADIEFSDLNLEELTAITNFGKITGVLKGYVHNLKIAYGQPVSFDALFETVKKKGIPQKINVEAVDNIAQLGGSGSSFQGLGKLVTIFFKEFPYEQIGIRCTLKNDVFTIRGTVISDHTEYLVKRKGFTGINVINRNPENNISFKDMIKRLQRITQTSKPVINP